jgi:hypothetical protein
LYAISRRFLIKVIKSTGVSSQNTVKDPNVFVALSQLSFSTPSLRNLRHCAQPKVKARLILSLRQRLLKKKKRRLGDLGNVMDVGREEVGVGG